MLKIYFKVSLTFDVDSLSQQQIQEIRDDISMSQHYRRFEPPSRLPVSDIKVEVLP